VTVAEVHKERTETGEEKRAVHEVEQDRDHQDDHTAEFRPEAEKRPKRTRPWGRRKPKPGPKTGSSSESESTDAAEMPKKDTGSHNEGSSAD